MVDIPQVNSIAALAALDHAHVPAASLTAAGLFGQFNWTTGNLSTQVTNDPGQGVYVAPTSDTTGASGAWVRQYTDGEVDFAWWGADGTTANTSTAWANWNVWAKYQSSLGNGVVLRCQPISYTYDNALCQRFLFGIQNLRIKGNGAIFQNVTTNASWTIAWELDAAGQGTGYLINSTTVGATSVGTITDSDAGNFSVGQWALVMSLDTMYFGFPSNCYYYDYVLITSVDASTGAITFDQSLRYEHLSTFPDGGNSFPCGAARIWTLNATTTWDVTHIYEDLTILGALHGASSPVSYVSMIGRSIVWERSTLNGISPSVIGNCRISNCTVVNGSEPDKLYDSLLIENTVFLAGLTFASSNERTTLLNCTIPTLFIMGKQFLAKNCRIAQLFVAGGFGKCLDVTLQNCLVSAYTPPDWQAGAQTFIVNGTTISYANGVFTFANANAVGMVIGQAFHFASSGDGYAGDIGSGFVTSLTQSGSTVVVTTTCQSVGVPSWATGAVFVNRRGSFNVIDCDDGCDNIRRASQATKAKGQEGQYYLDYWGGQGSASGHFRDWGVPLSLTINVRQASTVSGAKFTLTFLLFSATNPASSESMVLVIDLTTAGVRKLDQDRFVGKQSADTLTYNSSPVAAIPTGVVLNGNAWPAWSLNYTPNSETLLQMPIVKLERYLDTGLYTDILTANLDPSGATLIATTGLLP